ncbi:hypothetical protein NLJ89_g6254 [Agrocybe chaxingu]|uniref:C2H2-type domain-containing protein n=1 Tax=Agrocybe chaxingu TaxID=84603 RepID=A0A9W8JZH5_9AGAR|nr:hypothetical protein NLJ89_g6254 [Agrocybe chaxingu]
MPADRSIPTYQCSYPDCNYTGSRLGAIIGHVNKLHKNGLRPFKCPVPGCTETFGSGSTLGSHKRECLRLYCARDGLDPNAMNALLPSGTVMVEDYLNPMEQDRDTTYGRSFDQEGSRGHLDEKMDEQDEVDGLLACISVPEPAAIRAGPLVPSLTSSVSSLESSFVELEIKREIKIEEEEIQLWPELPKVINHAVSAAPPLIHSPMPLPVAPRMRFMPPAIVPAVGALGHLSGQPMVQCVPPMPLYGLVQCLRQSPTLTLTLTLDTMGAAWRFSPPLSRSRLIPTRWRSALA